MKTVFRKFIEFKLHHVLFWSLYYLFWKMVYRGMYQDLGQLMSVTAVYVIVHATLYYFTQYFLIPKMLHRKTAFVFLISFIITSIIISIVMYGALGLIFKPKEFQSFGGSPIGAILYLLFSNIFTTGMLVGIKSMVEAYQTRRHNEKLKTQRLESELHYLKAQVNPHFLFNAINSIYVLIKLDPEKASQTLIKLSELLRSQLYDFGEKEIDIVKEMEYLDHYITLEKMRKGEQVQVEVTKPKELSGFKLPPLMLIPFLENSFKYVSSSKTGKNLIKVNFAYKNGVFTASFFNTKEFDLFKKEKHVGGIGLKNIKRRLELLYPKRHTLKIVEKEESFMVDLIIQIHEP